MDCFAIISDMRFPTKRPDKHARPVWLGFMTEAEITTQPRWRDWLNELTATGRVGRIVRDGSTLWISAERAS